MMPYYQQSLKELFSSLACDKEGLSQSEAEQRLKSYGPNRLREVPPPHPLVIFFDQFKSFIIYILLFAVAFALAIGEYADSLIIIVIVLINALIGFFQEYGAARSLAALKEMTRVMATVCRSKKRAAFSADHCRLPVLGFYAEEARVHAGLFAQLSKKGQLIGAHDLIIAATAIVHNCALLTANLQEFEKVPGLEAISFS